MEAELHEPSHKRVLAIMRNSEIYCKICLCYCWEKAVSEESVRRGIGSPWISNLAVCLQNIVAFNRMRLVSHCYPLGFTQSREDEALPVLVPRGWHSVVFHSRGSGALGWQVDIDGCQFKSTKSMMTKSMMSMHGILSMAFCRSRITMKEMGIEE